MKDSQEQLQLLTQQMNQLMQEKAELETRNKILEQVVRLNVEHVDQLQTNKVRYSTPSVNAKYPSQIQQLLDSWQRVIKVCRLKSEAGSICSAA